MIIIVANKLAYYTNYCSVNKRYNKLSIHKLKRDIIFLLTRLFNKLVLHTSHDYSITILCTFHYSKYKVHETMNTVDVSKHVIQEQQV